MPSRILFPGRHFAEPGMSAFQTDSLSVLHDKADPGQRIGILQRIAVHGEEIRCIAGGNLSFDSLEAGHGGRVDGYRLQRVEF